MTDITCYKVFYCDNKNRLWSSNKKNNDSGLWQRYYYKRQNLPRFDYPIFAFSTIEAARDFAQIGTGKVIASVTGKKSDMEMKYRLITNDRILQELLNFGNTIGTYIKKDGMDVVSIGITGTIGLDSIDSIEIVEDWRN